MEEVAMESGESKQIITCTIKIVCISFTDDDLNKTFNLPEENLSALSIDEEVVDFTEFINYAAEIDLAILNKKHVRREFSFMYDTILKVFVGRNTRWDQVSYIAQYLVFSLGQRRSVNVGKFMMKEHSISSKTNFFGN